ncbi:enoyl-CoA hydratase [Comamonas serinivorans]|uniref:Enoyl-CoA hydratase n=1 Tax=Comamonas serinivorans TaxID=1082851 RepID=A0A1Y0EK47_9BURK|nr:crotonase/enoyl-CoA hydratase family protein [Comamonas serinivorans]ARU03957.1 enoyl-CoA hydratase [Comamonas serinivorans]
MSDRIVIDRLPGGVAHVQLVRTDKMNALDPEMFNGLNAAAESLAQDKSLRAVVISGQGKAFCAGLDMGSFHKMKEGGEPTSAKDLSVRTHGLANAAQNVSVAWRSLPVPVIAAVHGVAFGGGLQVALGADIRLVTADAKLSVMEIKWGLVPDMGGMPRLRSLCRDDVARELTYTGRIVSGTEAVALGLATRVEADPVAAALDMAHAIAGKNPDAIRAGKRLLNASEDVGVSTGELLLAESVEQQALIGTANQAEAVKANMDKRAPVFADPA